jgi:hypothetical protein
MKLLYVLFFESLFHPENASKFAKVLSSLSRHQRGVIEDMKTLAR